MSASAELIEAVRSRAADTPYQLQVTPEGFDLGVDLADVRYHTLMFQKGLEKTFTYRVRLDEAARTMAITDDTYQLAWEGGADVSGGTPVPRLGARMSRAMGRIHNKSFQKTYALDERGRPGEVISYRFDSGEGRDLIREPARQLGWTEKAGTAQRIGIVAAGVGVLVAALVVVLLLVLR